MIRARLPRGVSCVAPLALALAITHVLAPPRAAACGGFFCSSSPIDQAGETIVYGFEDDGTLTMSVQIRYAGDDDDFAWILPVPAPPEIGIGSEALFTALEGATRPAFVTERTTRGTCREHPRCVEESSCGEVSGCGYDGDYEDPGWTGGYVDAGEGERTSAEVDAGAPSQGVTIFSRGAVGPYDTVVLGATTAAEVLAWLDENGYDIPSSSEPLLDSYAAAGFVFVALRLSSNATTRMLAPIVLRMPTDEACLPIRLTAIATVPDMPIRTFFLGRERVVPINYSTAEIDTADIAFWRGERSWPLEVTRAVDELGGQAFVTEYAGATPAISLELPSVLDLAAETDPAIFLRTLTARGYPPEARLLELFQRHLEPPSAGLDTAYYNCLVLQTTSACGEPNRFDPVGLAEGIERDITAPRRDAHALVHRHGYLTRLFTTMSAEDMTLDPVFVTDPEQGDVDNRHVATLVTECGDAYFPEGAPQHYELDGEEHVERAGEPASDRAYCAELGGVPDYEATDCSSYDDDSSGCLCGVKAPSPFSNGFFGGLIGLVLALRLWRRRG